jgi:Recombinase
MSLRRKRRRKRQQRHHHERQPARRSQPGHYVREVDAWPLPDWALGTPPDREAADGTARRVPTQDPPDVDKVHPTVRSSSRATQTAGEVERLAYTRRQAAEVLGVSISTIDRRVVPSISTVKLPWGQRLIPVAELERFVRNHLAPARRRPPARPAGRPPTLPRNVVERIRLEYARGRSLAEIARALTAEGVPTAHGGRQWWPSTVRAVLVR